MKKHPKKPLRNQKRTSGSKATSTSSRHFKKKTVSSRAVSHPTPPQIIAFYKPYGVLCQFTTHDNTPTLADFHFPPEVYPVGRLDKDSEGLLLLSNDADFIHHTLDPKFHHEKSYLVQVEGIPDENALKKLRQGVKLSDFTTRPAQARLLSSPPELPPRIPPIRVRLHIPDTWLEITITEGKNRQVRRMTAAVGFPTLRLVRIRSGNVHLHDLNLQPGEWKVLPSRER